MLVPVFVFMFLHVPYDNERVLCSCTCFIFAAVFHFSTGVCADALRFVFCAICRVL